MILSRDEQGERLDWFDTAVRAVTHMLEQDPRVVKPRLFLRNAHFGRARAFDRLKKYAEAVKDWDKAIELSPSPERPRFRAARAFSRLQAGQVAEAVADVAELTKLSWNA